MARLILFLPLDALIALVLQKAEAALDKAGLHLQLFPLLFLSDFGVMLTLQRGDDLVEFHVDRKLGHTLVCGFQREEVLHGVLELELLDVLRV